MFRVNAETRKIAPPEQRGDFGSNPKIPSIRTNNQLSFVPDNASVAGYACITNGRFEPGLDIAFHLINPLLVQTNSLLFIVQISLGDEDA